MAACIAPTDNPLHESRLYAMMHIAIHDALNAIERRSGRTHSRALVPSASVERRLPRPPTTCWSRPPGHPGTVPAGMWSGRRGQCRGRLRGRAGRDPRRRAKTRGRPRTRRGRGDPALRADDGSDTPLIVEDYHRAPARRVPVHAGHAVRVRARWGDVTPFVLRDESQFRAAPPYTVTSKKYAADFNEVKRLGGDGVTTPSARTAEQTRDRPVLGRELAAAVEPDRPHGLGRRRARSRGRTPGCSACSTWRWPTATSASFEAKYHYNFWRPVTAIRDGRHRRQPGHAADPTWTPLMPTPPIPDHDSAHSVEGGAAAAGPQAVLRHRRHQFREVQPDAAGRAEPAPTRRRCCRSYTSFTEAADENGESRGSWSDSTSATRSTRASTTVGASPTAPSTASCDPCRDLACRRRGVKQDRPLTWRQ